MTYMLPVAGVLLGVLFMQGCGGGAKEPEGPKPTGVIIEPPATPAPNCTYEDLGETKPVIFVQGLPTLDDGTLKMWCWMNCGLENWPDDQIPSTGEFCGWHYFALEAMPDMGFLFVHSGLDGQTNDILVTPEGQASNQMWAFCSDDKTCQVALSSR